MTTDDDETFVDPRITATTQTLAPAAATTLSVSDASVTAVLEARPAEPETAPLASSDQVADDDATLRDTPLQHGFRPLPDGTDAAGTLATGSDPKAVRFVVKTKG